MSTIATERRAETKPRYDILDGLRGVAALMVIWYHFFEGFATTPVDQMFNHGYLAVDFFFVLSGFVIGYAYNDRMRYGGMTAGQFMLRRVIRLHPMVVMGALLGLGSYALQGCMHWDGTQVAWPTVVLALAMTLLMLPAVPGAAVEVRGNGEMFPINGPQWSLFFEYIGSALYALVLHRLSTRGLRWVVRLSAVGLVACMAFNMSGSYHMGVGWSIDGWGWLGGLLRMLFSFGMGLLLSRQARDRKRVNGAFWICSAVIVAVLAMPYVGSADGMEPSVANGVYDLACILVVFPFVVSLGARGDAADAFSERVCGFLGRISYPVYIIHYPAMYYLYYQVWSRGLGFGDVWMVCLAMFVGIVMMAWAALRWYDEPVRRWLSGRLLTRR